MMCLVMTGCRGILEIKAMPKLRTTDNVKVGYYADRQLEKEFRKLINEKFKGQPSKAYEAAVRAFLKQNQQ